jgi:hypothetical protein
MDYTFSEESQTMRAELERQLLGLAEEHGTAVQHGARGSDPVQQGLCAAGWDGLLTTPAIPLVEAVHVAEAFGAVPVPSPTAMTVGFLLPLLEQLAGPSVDDVTAAVTAGVPVSAPPPTLRRDADGTWRWTLWSSPLTQAPDGLISGRLEHVPQAPHAQRVLAPALLRERTALVVVRADVSTTTVISETGLDVRWPVGSVDVQDLEEVDVIDAADMEGAVAHAAARLSLMLDAEAVGGAHEVMRRTVTYVSGRQQFGRPVGSFQAVRHRVANMAIRIENSRSLLHHAAWRLDAVGPEDAFTDIAVSRLHAAETYRQVCASAIQCHGGMGFTWEQGLHVFYRAALTAGSLLTDVPHLVAALAARITVPHRTLAARPVG